ncbi:MAG: TonB-dependent receptor [Bryobacteraceae bacterium]|nr:TonB-dependent receptor [Bryobacteraceae bacterium]
MPTLLLLSVLGQVYGQDTAGVGSLIGKVNRAARQPATSQVESLAAVRVCLVELARCTTSDALGEFRLSDIRSGTYSLEVQITGEPPLRQSGIDIRAGLEARVEISVPDLGSVRQEVTVSDSIFVAPEEVKGSSFLVQPREILKSAGAIQDVSRYLQTLPGVAIGSDDFRNDLIVRGGSPLENLFVIDNIEIPNINNFANFGTAGGPVSMLDANLIRDVNFLTGAFPAPFTNRLSSVLQVTQREGDRQNFTGRADLAFAGAGAILEGPLAKGKGSWIVSARRSFLDFFTDDVGFGGVPVNYNLNAKLVYDVSPRDRIWFVNITGYDFINISPQANEPEDTLTVNYRGWRTGAGLNWQRLFGTRGVGLLGLTHSEASVRETQTDVRLNNQTTFTDRTREGETTLKYDLSVYVPVFNKVQAGGTLKLFRVNLNATQPFGGESQFSDQERVLPFNIQNRFNVVQPGAYLQTTQTLGKRLSLTWGGRFDNYRYLGATRWSPRAGLSYRLTDKLSWRIAWGTYYQQPVFFVSGAFAQNRQLLPMRSDHLVTGFTWIVNNTTRVTLEGYYKRYKDYPVAALFPQFTLANAGDSFGQDDLLLPYTSGGRGRVRGVELFLEKKFSRKWFGQTNLSWSRARHSGFDGVLRPGSFDYPIIFNAVVGYAFNRKWDFSARTVYLTGRPTTPFDPVLSAAQRRGVLDVARFNAARAPSYYRLDFRVDRTFTFRDKPVVLFGGLQNATNRQNYAFPGWNRVTNREERETQLGLFPIVGLNWKF